MFSDMADSAKKEILRCWYGAAGVIALLADSQNTPIRMAWAGWPQAGWNHTGRGAVPTQEAKFPAVSQRFSCPDPIKRNSRSENREKFFRFLGKPIDETHMKAEGGLGDDRKAPSL